MQGTALTALEPLVFLQISTEIGLVLAPAVDGMLSQPVAPTHSCPVDFEAKPKELTGRSRSQVRTELNS